VQSDGKGEGRQLSSRDVSEIREIMNNLANSLIRQTRQFRIHGTNASLYKIFICKSSLQVHRMKYRTIEI
jgi:hypothetical protein